MKTKDLQQMFSTEERVRILEHVLYGGSLNTNFLSKGTGVNKGLVSRYLSMLVSFGMLGKSGKSYVLKGNSLLCRSVKVLLNTIKLSSIKPFDKKITGIGVYGSYANGTNTPESDIDIWIKAKCPLNEERVARFEYEMTKRLGNRANVAVLYSDKIRRLKKEDKEFYYSVASSSIVLWGEGLGD